MYSTESIQQLKEYCSSKNYRVNGDLRVKQNYLNAIADAEDIEIKVPTIVEKPTVAVEAEKEFENELEGYPVNYVEDREIKIVDQVIRLCSDQDFFSKSEVGKNLTMYKFAMIDVRKNKVQVCLLVNNVFNKERAFCSTQFGKSQPIRTASTTKEAARLFLTTVEQVIEAQVFRGAISNHLYQRFMPTLNLIYSDRQPVKIVPKNTLRTQMVAKKSTPKEIKQEEYQTWNPLKVAIAH